MSNNVIRVDFSKEKKERKKINWEFVISTSFLLFMCGVMISLFRKLLS